MSTLTTGLVLVALLTLTLSHTQTRAMSPALLLAVSNCCSSRTVIKSAKGGTIRQAYFDLMLRYSNDDDDHSPWVSTPSASASGSLSYQKYLQNGNSCLSNGPQVAGRGSAHSGVADLDVLPARSRVVPARLLPELLGKQAAILYAILQPSPHW